MAFPESSEVTAGNTAFASEYNSVRKDALVAGGDYAVASGSSNAFVLSLDADAIDAYETGLSIKFKANHTIDGPVTINVNSLGAKSLKKLDGDELLHDDIINGQIVVAIYDGTDFYLTSPLADLFVPKFIIPSACNGNADNGSYQINEARDKLVFETGSNVDYFDILSTKIIPNVISVFDGGNNGDFSPIPYDDSGTPYIISPVSGTPDSYYRYDDDTDNETLMTNSATDVTTLGVDGVFDFNDSVLLLLDSPTSTTVRRYTISGTTISDAATATLTLNTAPTSAKALYVNSSYLYILDVESNVWQLLKYNKSTGVQISKTPLSNNTRRVQLTWDPREEQLYVMSVDSGNEPLGGIYVYPLP